MAITQERWLALCAELQQQLQRLGADPARTVVLLPYAQLLPVVRAHWAQLPQAGLLPRIETTFNWAARLAPHVPAAGDYSQDAAQDLLTAGQLLQAAGLHQQASWLAGRVREAAQQLAALAQAQPPQQRLAWMQALLPQLLDSLGAAPMRYEQLVAQVALAWVGSSSYGTDILFEALEQEAPDALILLRGYQRDPLSEALYARWLEQQPEAACAIDLPQFWEKAGETAPMAPVQWHRARDLEDQAARAAACVQQAVEGRTGLVALVDSDRALTRRIRAQLEAQHLTVRDETGWKLSTTRAASQLMSLLRACAPQAGSDAVLEWLKLAQTVPGSAVSAGWVQPLEAWLREREQAQWPHRQAWLQWEHACRVQALQVEDWRQALQKPRRLAQWLTDLQDTLQHSGQWDWLQHDAAGKELLQALHLQPGALPLAVDTQLWNQPDFVRWVQDVLEAGSFKPPYPLEEQVVILPLSQLLARSFAAVVIPACDDQHLPAAPEPPGDWTSSQRELIGLPSRQQLQQAQRAAWLHAWQFPQLALLTSDSDGAGETLLSSPLLLEALLPSAMGSGRHVQLAADLRVLRTLPRDPVAMPQAPGYQLPLARISASAYDTLRACPYQFFGQQQLRLREVNELTAELDKRDVGNWLHQLLYLFHEYWQQAGGQDVAEAQLRQWLDQAADEALRQEGLDAVDFVPWQAVWPRLRDGYLDWLMAYRQQEQARYAHGEQWRDKPLAEVFAGLGADQPAEGEPAIACDPARIPPISLHGRIDRVDALTAPDDAARWLLLDYKSESLQKTRNRVRDGDEDAQLSFYAAMMAPDPVRVAYVNVGENGSTEMHELEGVQRQSRLLMRSLAYDLQRIADGQPLQALGQGARCDYCAMRGLCRRDFWMEEQA